MNKVHFAIWLTLLTTYVGPCELDAQAASENRSKDMTPALPPGGHNAFKPYMLSISVAWQGGDLNHVNPAFNVTFTNNSPIPLSFGPILDQYQAIRVEYQPAPSVNRKSTRWILISPIQGAIESSVPDENEHTIIIATPGGLNFTIAPGVQRTDLLLPHVKTIAQGTYRFTICLILADPTKSARDLKSNGLSIKSNTIVMYRDKSGFKLVSPLKQVKT